MPGPTATPTPASPYDQYTQLLLRRGALQSELQSRPTDRALQDELAAVEQELARLQVQVARGVAPRPSATPAGQATAQPTPSPASASQGAPAGSAQGMSLDQLMQLVAPTADIQRRAQDLAEQEFAYKQWLDAQDRIRQQTQDAWNMFVDRLRYGGLSGGTTPGVSYGQAMPYLVAPGTQFIPGFEPGGPVARLYQMNGLQYDPNQWRTAAVPVATPVAAQPVEWPTWAP